MERLKKLGLSSEFGLFMKSETSRMSECLHGIHKSLHVSPQNETTISIHMLSSSLLLGGTRCIVTVESRVGALSWTSAHASHFMGLPYSQKYWWELNLVVEPKITIARILVDLNLAVRYGIAIRITRAL